MTGSDPVIFVFAMLERHVADEIVVSLDGMGGDRSPEVVLAGAELARVRHPNAKFLLFGPEEVLTAAMARHPNLADVTEIRHAPDVITGDDKPSVALRQGRNSSMRLAIDAVKAGDAHCVVSAGNTGALMALAKFVFKTMSGIDRPAIASFFPTLRGESVMLDLGANVQCDAKNLLEFALMGEVFAGTVLGVTQPTVGILNVGSEALKGNEAVQQAHGLLSESAISGMFRGFIEGDDIAAGTVDVIVTDGFTGNVALKTAEGTARLVSELVRATFRNSLLASLGYILARPAMRKLRARLDPGRYNGAMFLGLNSVAVKSHGGTDASGFANAIGVAIDTVQLGLVEKIREDFELVYGAEAAEPRAVAE